MSPFARHKAALLAAQEAHKEAERQWEAEMEQELVELEEMEGQEEVWRV